MIIMILSGEEEDINYKKVDSSFHEDEEPRENGEDINGALVTYEDVKTQDDVKKLVGGCSYEDLMYTNK